MTTAAPQTLTVPAPFIAALHRVKTSASRPVNGKLLLSLGFTVTHLEGVRPLPGRVLAVARIPSVLPSFPVTNDSKHDSPATRIPASRNAFQFLRHPEMSTEGLVPHQPPRIK